MEITTFSIDIEILKDISIDIEISIYDPFTNLKPGPTSNLVQIKFYSGSMCTEYTVPYYNNKSITIVILIDHKEKEVYPLLNIVYQ